MKKKTWQERFEEKCLELSYMHNNEITLTIDDLTEYIQQELDRQREEIIEELEGLKYKRLKGYLHYDYYWLSKAIDEAIKQIKK